MSDDKVEMELTRKRNYQRIRELIRISFGLGVNLTSPTRFKDSLRIINVILTVSSLLTMYGHWSMVMRYLNDIPRMAESFSTALQSLISIVKLIYYLFTQRQFYRLLRTAQTHELLIKSEIFHKDFPIHKQLKEESNVLMDKTWTSIRRQLVFYICSCTLIISNYFFAALFTNYYHYVQQTPNYQHILPLPSLYPVWEDKGMSFPYYPLQMWLSGCSAYIAGMCAVGFDGVFIVLSMHGVGLIHVLKAMIKHSTSPLVPKERRVEYLRYCIYQYQRIFDYSLEIKNMYKHISITQFLLSLLVLGVVLFQMSFGLESDKITLLRMLMYISAAGYQIVIYCYNGQRLTTASEALPYAFYSCEWYNESEEFKQLLRMMIMRTNRSIYMDISWFTTMSMPTLMAMAKTSGSYFLLLRNLAE